MKLATSAAIALLFPFAASAAPESMTRAIESPYAARWLQPQEPFRIFGETYFVGSFGMSNVLIRTDAGLVLIDGALPQSVAQIEENIRKLGFSIRDVKYILNTEAHFDHSGGIAALAYDSGAVTVASPLGAAALKEGRVLDSDPQHGEIANFPAVTQLRTIGDGEALHLGGTTITAHFTPGHTPGSTTWSWTACDAAKACRNVVFSASLSAVAADSYRFSDSKHGNYADNFRSSVRTIGKLPCDILITAHPEHSGMDAKLKLAPDAASFADPAACRAYSAKYEDLLDARLKKELAAQPR